MASDLRREGASVGPSADAGLGTPVDAAAALAAIWQEVGLPAAALASADLPGTEPALPSSFAIATALQSSLGAAALAAAQIGHLRGGPAQTVRVAAAEVLREASARFSIDGRVPSLWDKVSGLYACGGPGPGRSGPTGWVRIHANFAHHRDGALRLLGLPPGEATERTQVSAALGAWSAHAFEQAAADAGLVVAAVRGFDDWDEHPQGRAVATLPLMTLDRVGDGPAVAAGSALPPWQPGQRPLQGLRVLDLTRILAGPVAGRTLAAYGADVMLVNSPRLPNIEALADTSRGKLSVHLDLKTETGRETLRALVREADVLLQAYRPGGLAALGFGPAELARLRPGLVVVSLSAYGQAGPWSTRRGFDSLVQSATGFNRAEAQAFGQAEPRALPVQALDYSAGFLMAFGALAAWLRRTREGGSWHVQVSLARTGLWLRQLGRVQGFQAVAPPDFDGALEVTDSGFGRLGAVRHAAWFSHTPPAWTRPSMPPGSHPPMWPPR